MTMTQRFAKFDADNAGLTERALCWKLFVLECRNLARAARLTALFG